MNNQIRTTRPRDTNNHAYMRVRVLISYCLIAFPYSTRPVGRVLDGSRNLMPVLNGAQPKILDQDMTRDRSSQTISRGTCSHGVLQHILDITNKYNRNTWIAIQ